MGRIIKLVKGGVISIAIFVAITAVLAMLLRFSGVPEEFSWVYIVAALSAACAFMGLYSGNLFGKRGLLTGCVFSTLLLIIILLITSLCFSVNIGMDTLSVLYLIPIVIGALAGIFGANLKN